VRPSSVVRNDLESTPPSVVPSAAPAAGFASATIRAVRVAARDDRRCAEQNATSTTAQRLLARPNEDERKSHPATEQHKHQHPAIIVRAPERNTPDDGDCRARPAQRAKFFKSDS
jgi:hypothetical protein